MSQEDRETMTLNIRALIFDLDGVITDTAEFHYLSWKRLADEEGLSFTREDNESLRGVSRRESLNRLLKGRAVDDQTARLWMERKNAYYLEHLKRLTPDDRLPGVSALLRDARGAGLRVALGSASRNAREVLERLDMLADFDAIGDGNCVVNTKPAADLFIWVAGRLDVHPDEAAVFEDAEAGIQAARTGGFWTVGIGAATHGIAHVHFSGMAEVMLDAVLEGLAAVPRK